MMPVMLYAVINVVTALLFAGLSAPLILRKMPMNPFYGVRFPQSFHSPEAWYEINAFGGKALLMASMPILFVGIYGMLRKPEAYFWISTPTLMISVILAACATYGKARRMGKKAAACDPRFRGMAAGKMKSDEGTP